MANNKIRHQDVSDPVSAFKSIVLSVLRHQEELASPREFERCGFRLDGASTGPLLNDIYSYDLGIYFWATYLNNLMYANMLCSHGLASRRKLLVHNDRTRDFLRETRPWKGQPARTAQAPAPQPAGSLYSRPVLEEVSAKK